MSTYPLAVPPDDPSLFGDMDGAGRMSPACITPPAFLFDRQVLVRFFLNLSFSSIPLCRAM